MKCTHRSFEDAHGKFDALSDPDSGVGIIVRRTGAEMVSLHKAGEDGDVVGFLYRDGEGAPPASGWANHATVMGYYIHRLLGGATVYRGVPIRGGNHGFLRSFEFGPPVFDGDSGSLTYRVRAADIPKEAYPLRVAMDLTYSIAGGELDVRFSFRNEEPEIAAHLSFGLHPGFAVSDLVAAEVLLPPGTYRRLWAPGNFLNGAVDEIPFAGGPMPFDKAALPDSFIVALAGVPDPVIVLRDAAAGREVRLDFSEVPYFTLWSDGSEMICIEPCWGLPDSDPQKPFEDKDGIQMIPPGSVLSAGFRIRPVVMP